jgi:hypothetical protein
MTQLIIPETEEEDLLMHSTMQNFTHQIHGSISLVRRYTFTDMVDVIFDFTTQDNASWRRDNFMGYLEGYLYQMKEGDAWFEIKHKNHVVCYMYHNGICKISKQ